MKVADITKHFQDLVDGKAVYVWGANCEKITESMTTRLYKTYGSSQYNKAYYNAKLNEGKGRIGADCSGSFYPVSGYDTTANGYYSFCTAKGEIASMPKKPCMVFVKQNGKMVHVGWHDGKGSVYEMKDSKSNVKYGPIDRRWTHWGQPEFAEYEENEETFMVELRTLKKGMKGDDVKALQILLIGNGYSCGKTGADGDFGANTKTAVEKFQKKKGLSVDGIAGRNTMQTLLT